MASPAGQGSMDRSVVLKGETKLHPECERQMLTGAGKMGIRY